MTQLPVKVGADTQAWCTSCRAMHEHVVVAMVGALPAKVECGECHKQHLFRAGPPGTAKVKAPSGGTRPRRASSEAGRAESARPAKVDLATLIAGRPIRAYAPGSIFAAGDVVRHPSFGVGAVLALPGPQKMEVAFEGGQKLLVHDRGAPPPPMLAPPERQPDDGTRRVSDAPPDRPPRH